MRFFNRKRGLPFIEDGGQDVRRDSGCWACSKWPTTIQQQTCAVDGCERSATNVLAYYWNPFPGLGGRHLDYLCPGHGVEVARQIYVSTGEPDPHRRTNSLAALAALSADPQEAAAMREP